MKSSCIWMNKHGLGDRVSNSHSKQSWYSVGSPTRRRRTPSELWTVGALSSFWPGSSCKEDGVGDVGPDPCSVRGTEFFFLETHSEMDSSRMHTRLLIWGNSLKGLLAEGLHADRRGVHWCPGQARSLIIEQPKCIFNINFSLKKLLRGIDAFDFWTNVSNPSVPDPLWFEVRNK